MIGMNATRGFEDLYTGLRQMEQRIYSDEQLLQLPGIAPGHVHEKEWKIRQRSMTRLITYLANKRLPLKILEIGCGNGWLASRLAEIPNADVTGIDTNSSEIDQALRVFRKINLRFLASRFSPQAFSGNQFDIVLFASAIQYFSPLSSVLNLAMLSVAPGGEIHIIDSCFYTSKNIAAAIDRTRDYFNSQGFPEMAYYYNHHQLDDLKGFDYEILFDPHAILHKIFHRDPFYWICIKKPAGSL